MKLIVTSKTCFEYDEVVQWKGNFPNYLKELKKKRDAGQPSGTIFMIYVELNIISSNTWVLDTACITHICNLLQMFKRNKYMKRETLVYSWAIMQGCIWKPKETMFRSFQMDWKLF
jgi:hypothetical protein